MFEETMRKWNYEIHDYEPYSLPSEKGWYTPLVSEDMELKINCASCGVEKTFGECYTSKTIHNPVGFGFNVCEGCHELERTEEERHRER